LPGHALFKDVGLQVLDRLHDLSHADAFFPLQFIQVDVFLLFLKSTDTLDQLLDCASLLRLGGLPGSEVDCQVVHVVLYVDQLGIKHFDQACIMLFHR